MPLHFPAVLLTTFVDLCLFSYMLSWSVIHLYFVYDYLKRRVVNELYRVQQTDPIP